MEKTLECTTIGCTGIGQPEYSGKCQSCYHGNRDCQLETGTHFKDLSSGSERDVMTDAGEGEVASEGGPRKCIADGCSNYGNPKNNFLCNGCLSYIQKELANRGFCEEQNGSCPTPMCRNDSIPGQLCDECKKIFSSNRPLRLTTQLSKIKCATETCFNYGNIDKGNLCNECYNNYHFSCKTKNCPNLSLAKNYFLCNGCKKLNESPVKLHVPLVCSTPQCSRQADEKFDFKCEQCFTAKLTLCKSPGCNELAGNEDLCCMCVLRMTPTSGALTGGAGDASSICDTLDTSDLNISDGSSQAGAEFGASTDWKQCLTPGCANVGTASGKGLCYECYITHGRVVQKCITPGCKERGQQHLEGFCQKCFISGHNLDPSHLSFTGNKSKACITPNCEFFSIDKQGGRCSRCFKEYSKAPTLVASEPATFESPEASDHLRCKTQGCEFYGNPQTMALCSGCFRNYLEDEPQPSESTRRRHVSGPSTYFPTNKEKIPNTEYNGASAIGATNLTLSPPARDLSRKVEGKVSTSENRSLQLQSNTPEILIQSPDIKTSSRKDTAQILSEIQTAVQVNEQFSAPPVYRDPLQTNNPSGIPVKPLASTGYVGRTKLSQAEVSESAQPLLLPRGQDPLIPPLEHVNSNELFGGEGLGNARPCIPRSISSPGGFTILPHKCSNSSCERNCVGETYPFCMSCYEAIQLQPKAQTEAASMPLSPQTIDQLKIDQSSKLKSCSNPDLQSLSDICENPGCENTVSALHYPLCRGCSEEHEQQGKARPTAEGNQVQDSHPAASGVHGGSHGSGEGTAQSTTVNTSKDLSNKGNTHNEVQKKKVSLKPVCLDPCNIRCDVIICLWNKHNIDRGTHPMLSKIGNVVQSMETFKSALLRDEVCETKGGATKANSILHCKYEQAADRQVANALLTCVSYTESRKMTSIVLPVMYCEDLKQNLGMATRVCMYLISQLQTNNRYSQSLGKLIMCVDSEDAIKCCKEEFVSINARKMREKMPAEFRPNCHHCKKKPSAKLKPLSPSCADPCCVFCITCLKHGRQEGLKCPNHGPCLAPVGHKNTFALLVTGFDKTAHIAQLFIDDTNRMARALANKDSIGISTTNMEVITPAVPGKEEDMKTRLIEAFSRLRRKMMGSNHIVFYFYYSGHNDSKAFKLGGGNNVMTPKELKRELWKLYADNILIILDCCYSGGSNLTDINDEDFTSSLGGCGSKDDSEPMPVYLPLPKLWNLEDDLEEDSGGAKGNPTTVYQWASSVADERSYYKGGQSFFTHCIVQALKGQCPSKQVGCKSCQAYKQKVMTADGIYLDTIHESVMCHVPQLAEKMGREQHPKLDSNSTSEEDFLFAFHFY